MDHSSTSHFLTERFYDRANHFEIMKGSFLKTAICVSLLVHLAGYAVVTHFPAHRPKSSSHQMGQLPVLAVIAATGLQSSPEAAPVQPVAQPVRQALPPVPEIAAVKPLEAEIPPTPPEPVVKPTLVESEPLPDPAPTPASVNPAPSASVA